MIQLPETAPGFDDPLSLLAACHGRIEAQCELLLRLQAHLGQFGSDIQASQAARRIRQYFTTAGRHHHEDEEQDFFPMLAAYARAQQRTEILTLMDALRQEHAQLGALWEALIPQLERIITGDRVAPDRLPAADFSQGNRDHIQQENLLILPFAHQVITAEDLRQLGSAMAARRGQPVSGNQP